MLHLQDQTASELEFGFGISWGHEPIVTDADEARGQDVQEEATDELLGADGDGSMCTRGTVVAGAEGHLVIHAAEEPLVGDGHPMGIAAEVAECLLGSIEGSLGVDAPFFASEFSQEPMEGLGVLEVLRRWGEAKISSMEEFLECVEELSTEELGQSLDGDEEAVLGGDPFPFRGIESASCDHDVQMGVELQLLIPGVKHGGEAHMSGQPGIASGQLEQSAGSRAKQGVVQELLVAQDEGVELVWEGGHRMEVVDGQQPEHAAMEPSDLLEALAFGTVAIAAGVIRDPSVAATVLTQRDASPQLRGAAEHDIPHGPLLVRVEGMLTSVLSPVEAEDLGDFDRHDALRALEQVPGALGAGEVLGAHLGVAHRGVDGGMAKEHLDHTDVASGFQKVGGKAVTKGVRGDLFG